MEEGDLQLHQGLICYFVGRKTMIPEGLHHVMAIWGVLVIESGVDDPSCNTEMSQSKNACPGELLRLTLWSFPTPSCPLLLE